MDPEALESAMAEDPDATLALLMRMSRATDVELRAKVLALVPRLILDRARRGPRGRSGTGRLKRIRADQGGDLDLDASLPAIAAARAEHRPVGLDELTATDWDRPQTALCLLVDRSGSMEGAQLATAALAAAACTLRAAERGGEFAVIAFDRRSEVLVDIARPEAAEQAVARVLSLRGHGMTSLDAALRAASIQLRRARARRTVCLLLSDCRVTDDIDPTAAAAGLRLSRFDLGWSG